MQTTYSVCWPIASVAPGAPLARDYFPGAHAAPNASRDVATAVSLQRAALCRTLAVAPWGPGGRGARVQPGGDAGDEAYEGAMEDAAEVAEADEADPEAATTRRDAALAGWAAEWARALTGAEGAACRRLEAHVAGLGEPVPAHVPDAAAANTVGDAEVWWAAFRERRAFSWEE